MKNEYEIRGDTAVIFLQRKSGEALETTISLESLPRAMEFPGTWHAWYCNTTRSYYARGSLKVDSDWKKVYLHRWLVQPRQGRVVDHFNHDTLDNTDANLREVTYAENMQNLAGPNSNNMSSNIRGVTWRKDTQKWQAQVRANRKYYNLGSFDDLHKAEQAVVQKRRELHGSSFDRVGEAR